MFNIPNILTASNLICGILSIIFAFSGQLVWSCFFIYIAAVLDFFDGFLARKLNLSGELGKQLDSLADMVTFGVAPGILVCIILIIQSNGGVRFDENLSFSEAVFYHTHHFLALIASNAWSNVSWICLGGLLIPFFSMFRLAKFNIDTRQSDSFIGLPTPANTIFFTAFPLLLAQQYESGLENQILNTLLHPWFLLGISLVMSLLLIAELPLFSLKFKNFRWQDNQIRFVFLGACLLLISILLVWSIPIIVILYLILSIIDNKRKKASYEI